MNSKTYKALIENSCIVGKTHGEKPGAAMSLSVLAKRAKKDKNITIKKVKGILGTQKRPFTRVTANINGEVAEYWANLITGSLYTDDGACITSDMLRIVR